MLAVDVNDDAQVSPIDALLVIHLLSTRPREEWVLTGPVGNNDYLDTSGDSLVSPLDVLLVIDKLYLPTNRALPVALERDSGSSATDRVTNVAAFLGNVKAAGLGSPMSVSARIDRGPVFSLPVDSAGNFVADATSFGGLLDGIHNATFATKYSDNSIAYARITLTLDTLSPSVSPLNVDSRDDTGHRSDDGVTSVTNPLITLNTETGAHLKLAMDSQILFDGLATSTVAQRTGNQADGTYQIVATATDLAGNVTISDPLSLVIDTTAPTVPTLDLAASSDSGTLGDRSTRFARVTLAGETEGNSFITVAGSNVVVRSSGNGTFRIPNISLNLGNNSVAMSVEDIAGNSSNGQQSFMRADEATSIDPVLRWNQASLEAIRLDATAPPVATRALAMASIAMLDVVNAIEGAPSYLISLAPPADVSMDAAISAAAFRVLSYLYPAQQATHQSVLTASLSSIPDGPAKTNGVAFGTSVGNGVIAIRSQDGWDKFVDHSSSTLAGKWQSTSPMYAVALAPQWGEVMPFAVSNVAALLPAAPPDLTSQEYAISLNEVKDLGRAVGSLRTDDQTEKAKFWADGAGTYTPPGHWNQIAAQFASSEGMSVGENARLFAMLNVALGDAAIVSWHSKYTYDLWRPITAIQNANRDGNDNTSVDATWSPLLITPPFPEYTSGHSTFSAAAAEVLTSYFGDNQPFTTTSIGLPGVARSYTSFEEAANEAGRSRVLGGIHYEFTNQVSLASGRQVGQEVLSRFKVSDDTRAPEIVFEQSSTGSVGNVNTTITGWAIDNLAGVASAEVQVDGGSYKSLALDAEGRFAIPTNLPVDGTSDGLHTVRVRATDAAGNRSTRDYEFSLDTRAPHISMTSLADQGTLSVASRLAGTADPTGSTLISLLYSFDGGMTTPVSFDSLTGTFDESLDLSHLTVGAHSLRVAATDAAGNRSTLSINLTLANAIPLAITEVVPANGSDDVGVTFRPKVVFSRPIDPTTLSASNFYATDTSGEKLTATITPSSDGSFAWLFFSAPMPGSSTITINVDGSTIRDANGTLLDAAGSGTPGSIRRTRFTTVSTSEVPNTSINGLVADPGADLKPMTFDDLRAGPDGQLMTADDLYLNPIAHAKVYILGQEGQFVYTDVQGRFNLPSVPTGNVKLVIDGRTATNAPNELYFPEMVMDMTVEPGRANTVMGSMGTREQQAALDAVPGVYLPRVRTDILQSVNPNGVTTIGVTAESSPNLTPEQRALLSIQVQPGSLIGENGQVLASGQVGISTVPPELVRDMLPAGLLQHTFDITIQAPGITTFRTPAPMTFPNVFNAPPGTKLNFLSFDHTTGRLVIEGTGTASADGLSVTSDPGTGITHPGWFGWTPPGSQGGSGGPPPPPPPNSSPIVVQPVVHPMISSEVGTFPTNSWTAPQGNPLLTVTITVDGTLDAFMKASGNLPLTSSSFTLSAGSTATKTFGAAAKSYIEMFGAGGLANVDRDRLYGSRVTVKEELTNTNGSVTTTIKTYLLYRWVTAVEANEALLKSGRTAAFFRTNTDGVVREKKIDTSLPSGMTRFDGGNVEFSLPAASGVSVTWTFDPAMAGTRATPVTIRSEFTIEGQPYSEAVGNLTARGTATAPTTVGINLDGSDGYKVELTRVLGTLTGDNGVDRKPGRANVNDDGIGAMDDLAEMGWPGSDDTVTYLISGIQLVKASDKFKSTFHSVFPWVNPTSAVMNSVITAQANALLTAVRSDYNQLAGYNIDGGASGGVTMSWGDLYESADNNNDGLADGAYFGEADGDRRRDSLAKTILSPSQNSVGKGAQQWFLAESINISPTNSGQFAVGINIDWTSSATFAQFVANTVSHEIAHTFGLVDLYDDNGVPYPPNDIMMNGGPNDPNLTFGQNNRLLLKAALGIQGNGDLPLMSALVFYQGIFNLPSLPANLPRSIRPPSQSSPTLVLRRDGFDFTGGETENFGVVAADGQDGQPQLRTYTVQNNGFAPLQIDAVALVNGDAGFSLVTAPTSGTTLAPFATTTLEVAFDPSAPGNLTDQLIITSNADFSPTFTLNLTGFGLANAGVIRVTVKDNNFGGVATGSAPIAEFATIINDGAQPLNISRIAITEGSTAFALTGVPANLSTNPIVLTTGQSFTFGAVFTPDGLGLRRAVISVVTNDPARPILRLGAVGTGLATMPTAEWGRDFAALERQGLAGAQPLRARSDDNGNFSFFLDANQNYHIVIFDPTTGLVAHGYGTTRASGQMTDLTTALVFGASSVADTDFDGLADDIEFALGTSVSKSDTDGDGLDDLAEVRQGLDPFDGRGLPAQFLGSVQLKDTPKRIAVDGDNAYIVTATGLTIVDISNSQSPILLSSIALPGTAVDLDVDTLNGLVAIASGSAGLHIVDVSDPLSPTLLRTVAGATKAVEVRDGIAYASYAIGFGDALRSIDLLTGTELHQVAFPVGIFEDEEILDIARDGNFLYLSNAGASNAGVIRIVEITDGYLTPRGAIQRPFGFFPAQRLFAGDGVLYATAGPQGGYQTVDVSNPDRPVVLSSEGGASGRTAFVANGSGTGLLIGTSGNLHELLLMNSTDPGQTGQLRLRMELPRSPLDVVIQDGMAYLIDGSGLNVINYLAADTQGSSPSVTISTTALDLDPAVDGLQVSVKTPLPIQVTAADDVQVTRVELLVNGEVVETDRSFAWDLQPILAGSIGSTLTIRVRAVDSGGNVALSDEIIVQRVADTTLPLLSMGSIVDVDQDLPGVQRFGGRAFSISGTASDDAGIEQLELRINGQLVDTDKRFPWQFTATMPNYAPDANTAVIEIRARDINGNVVNQTFNVELIPVVALSTTVSDADGVKPGVQVFEHSDISMRLDPRIFTNIAQVEFLVNGTVVANDNNSPWEFLTRAPGFRSDAASFTLQARAIAPNGSVELSQILSFELIPDTDGPTVSQFSPANDAIIVREAVNRIQFDFSEPIDPAMVALGSVQFVSAGASGAFGDGDDTQLPILGFEILNGEKTVALVIHTPPTGKYRLAFARDAFRDRSGNTLAAGGSTTFQVDGVLAVTHSGDSGPGSLRQAILDANSSTSDVIIVFSLASNDAGFSNGTFIIQPASPLPGINNLSAKITLDGFSQTAWGGNTNPNGPEVVLDGQRAGLLSDGLLIQSNSNRVRGLNVRSFDGNGISILGDGNVIASNFIGIDATGQNAAGNKRHGVYLGAGAALNRIGSDGDGQTDTAERNLISGNLLNGIEISGSGANENNITGNDIGVNRTGTSGIANLGGGILIGDGAQLNRIGGTLLALQNIIAFNERYGIAVAGAGTTRNRIDPNSIFLNKGLGIDLGADGQFATSDPGDGDTGPNEMQNTPSVVIALSNVLHGGFDDFNELRATGYFISGTNSEYVLDFYTTPVNDISIATTGKKWIHRVTITTDALGYANIDEYSIDVAPGGANAGEYLSVTATDALGNTSEFSNVQFINSQSSSEPNDTIQTARQVKLEPGVFYKDFGTIGNRSVNEPAGLDVDVMAVTLGPRERVRIDLDKSNPEFDAVLRLFDAAGQQLAISDNNAGPGEAPSNEPFIDYTVDVAGTYYIGISGKGNEAYSPSDTSSRTAGSYGRFTFDILSFGPNTGPQPIDEPNDTIVTAVMTGLDSVDQGRYVGVGVIGDNPNVPRSLDVDLFTFELIPEQQVRFRIDIIDGSGVDARVFNSDGIAIFEPDLFSSPGGLVFDFTAPSDCDPFFGCSSFAKPFILGISHLENSIYDPLVAGSGTPASHDDVLLGSYVLRIVYPEPNDVISEAYDTGLRSDSPGRFQGAFEIGDNRFGPNDVDLYSFHLDVGERVKVDIDADPLFGADTLLRLFNSLGEEVAVASSGTAPNEMDNSRDPYLVFVAPLAGSYYVGVSSEENQTYDPFREQSGFAFSGGSYGIEIRVGSELRIEPNDTIPSAVDTELSSSNPGTYTASGVVGDGGPFNIVDVDILKLQLNAGDRVQIDIDARELGSNLDSVLRLFDSNGLERASSNDNPAPEEPNTADSYIDFTASVTGEYYIGISANDNDSYDPFNQGSGDWSFAALGEYNVAITLSSGPGLQSRSAPPAHVTQTKPHYHDVAQSFEAITAATWARVLSLSSPPQFQIVVAGLAPGELGSSYLVTTIGTSAPALGLVVNADGVGWFIDSMPLDHGDFSSKLAAAGFAARPESSRYDLLTVWLHEIGHILGFTDEYTGIGPSGDYRHNNGPVDLAENSAAVRLEVLQFLSEQVTDVGQDDLICDYESIKTPLSAEIHDEFFKSFQRM